MGVKVLTALDHAKTQYYHFKAIMIAGMGLFTDAYDLFCITPVTKLIGRIYYESHDNKPVLMPPAVVTALVAVALAGTVIGNLVFGTLGDRIGRRRVYGFSLVLMVFASFASGFSVGRTRGCVLSSLCFFRFLLGIGIGGDYPLSATIMSEFANKRTRGSFIAAVFSMQGFGILAGSATTMAVALAFNRATDDSDITPLHTPGAADLAWRIILMIGAIPAALTFYWRMQMPETARYTALVAHDEIKATNDMEKVLGDFNLETIVETSVASPGPPPSPPAPTYGFFSKQFLRRHGRDLFACSMAWFLVDIPYYSSTLFQSQIYERRFSNTKDVNAYVEAYNVAKFQAIIAVASTIPGYFATMYFIDRIGRRKIQMMGFFFMAIFIFALAGPYDMYWHDHTNAYFFILYALTFFFSNFGPNTTTFIVPAELFPARFRSTCHGISGAAGKLGAIIGAVGFLWASQNTNRAKLRGWKPGIGMTNALLILGGVCIIGAVLTYVFTPETKMRSLEENEGGESQHRGNDIEVNEVEIRSNTSNASQLSSQPLFGPSPLSFSP